MSSTLAVTSYVVLALVAGCSFVAQQAVNSALRVALHSTAWAGFVSYLGGTLCMLFVALAARDSAPSGPVIAGTPWWAWTGGIFGAVYIAISIVLLPRLGAATFIALLVAGQMLFSLAFDHYGLFGLARHPIDGYRTAGAVLLVLGVLLIRS